MFTMLKKECFSALGRSAGDETAARLAQTSQEQMRGVSNAKAKRELNLQPRPLEWIVDTAAPQSAEAASGAVDSRAS